MQCALCKQEIEKYNQALNHLKLDETNSVDICTECSDRFLKWQREVFAKMFPTTAAKAMYK